MCSRRGVVAAALSAAAVVVLLISCSTPSKVRRLRRSAPEATLAMPGEKELKDEIDFASLPAKHDTLQIVDLHGRKVMLAPAVKDEEGKLMSHFTLDAVKVTARFRNVAERNGKVDLAFQIKVPKVMLESDWQTRFYPDMYMLGDSTRLQMLILTGAAYRKNQDRGYARYNAFLASIVSDTTKFINLSLLEKFLQRNIPQVYAFKTDSSFVSEEQFSSVYGVTEKMAVEHYTNKIARYFNNWKKRRIGAKYRRYIRAPYITENVRLDTVFRTGTGDFVYDYIQTIDVLPKLRKVDIVISGEIFQQDLLLYDIPRSQPLTFYISSLSAFTENRERYLTKTIYRRAEANSSYDIVFEPGRHEINPELGGNRGEIEHIKSNLREVLQDREFDLDSIIVRSFASPEGSYALNDRLAVQRADAACRYFSSFVKHVQDSLRRDAGFEVIVGDDMSATTKSAYTNKDIRFLSSAGGENWYDLEVLLQNDTLLKDSEKEAYLSMNEMTDLDAREMKMHTMAHYKYVKDLMYPKLRAVKFNFYLHRKNMTAEQVETTELDSTYMRGCQAIRDRDYKTACALLGSYKDFNSAVAYVAADRNASALEILEPMERTAVVNYLLAIVYSRQGDERAAVQCYLHACEQEPSYVHRGKLDPEIFALIKKYDLNKEDEEIVE